MKIQNRFANARLMHRGTPEAIRKLKIALLMQNHCFVGHWKLFVARVYLVAVRVGQTYVFSIGKSIVDKFYLFYFNKIIFKISLVILVSICKTSVRFRG